MRLLLLCLSLVLSSAHANDRFKDVVITTEHLGGGIHMLTGSGGNIGVSTGADGLLIIDDQFAPLAERISDTLKTLSPNPVKYVLNTHYHGDHTGGNAHFADTATIFAHDNVRMRLLDDANLTPKHLPVVTYSDGITFHFNDETIRVQHLANGHTDGDSVVRFEKAKVIHMGDLFFNGHFPYVDLDAGGSVTGYLNNVSSIIATLDDQTKIIPGHGKLATLEELKKFQKMLLDSIVWAKKQPKDADVAQWQSAFPASLTEWSWRFITTERWVETLYRDRQRIHD
ncbi:MBL fold metallo-hydrolase [Ferrimonas aestuarii]|uniref:MBL fold metallo-hydrolase n=1 Tax=Ferrimonas aestuarii TaxID=2569539 RepID=A0A4V5NWL0_9GAMM|nr:MBL fold metallo-hydrolase [Ferrimonas aestuarii]TKB58538.1 MBL fold metallo-hydrolase [Ferrimonas aestuarii]